MGRLECRRMRRRDCRLMPTRAASTRPCAQFVVAFDERATNNERNDRPWSPGLSRRSKIRGLDPHVMAVCSAHPTPPLLPLPHPVVELPRRSSMLLIPPESAGSLAGARFSVSLAPLVEDHVPVRSLLFRLVLRQVGSEPCHDSAVVEAPLASPEVAG